MRGRKEQQNDFIQLPNDTHTGQNKKMPENIIE